MLCTEICKVLAVIEGKCMNRPKLKINRGVVTVAVVATSLSLVVAQQAAGSADTTDEHLRDNKTSANFLIENNTSASSADAPASTKATVNIDNAVENNPAPATTPEIKVTVDGQNIAVPENGTTQQTITHDNGSTTLTVTNHSSSTGSATNTNTMSESVISTDGGSNGFFGLEDFPDDGL